MVYILAWAGAGKWCLILFLWLAACIILCDRWFGIKFEDYVFLYILYKIHRLVKRFLLKFITKKLSCFIWKENFRYYFLLQKQLRTKICLFYKSRIRKFLLNSNKSIKYLIKGEDWNLLSCYARLDSDFLWIIL